jgi:hypothetical protein
MKISKETIDVLKNFATINTNIVFKEGDSIRTINPGRNAFAKAKITENFSKEFAVYDLNELLSVISMSDEASVELADDRLLVDCGNFGVSEFYYSDTDLVQTPPDKEMPVPEGFFSVKITADTLKFWFNAVGTIAAPLLSIVADGTDATVVIGNPEISNSTKFKAKLCPTDKKFTASIPTESLKLLPAEYVISIPATGKYIHFSSVNGDLQYWLALDSKTSKFD